MVNRYEIEMSEPSWSQCSCCDGRTVKLTRFVYRDGDALGIYYAAYSNQRPHTEVAMLVSLGEWGEGSEPSQRAAFFCWIRPTEDSYEVMLGDAATSAWGDAEIVGKKLSRAEALGHPWKTTAFEVLDAALAQDRSLRGFVERVQCGDPAVPLERNFHAPDDIFALGEQAKTRAQVSRDFAALDGERFFVRCLLPVPVEGYGAWSVGLWAEVTRSDFGRVLQAWDDAGSYASLQFTGTIANDLHADLELPVAQKSSVQLHVPDPRSPPKIKATGELAELLTKSWPTSDFEAYAVARGFL